MLRFIACISISCLLLVTTASADRIRGRFGRNNSALTSSHRTDFRLTTRSLLLSGSEAGDFRVGKEFGDAVTKSVDSNFFDPFTLHQLRAIKEMAQPSLNSDDYDYEKTRFVVQKTFTIQSANTIIPIIHGSELREEFDFIQAGLRSFADTFHFSVQDEGSGISFSGSKKGRNLIDFSPQFSAKQGLDPQIRIGEALRFRYDWLDKKSVLELSYVF